MPPGHAYDSPVGSEQAEAGGREGLSGVQGSHEAAQGGDGQAAPGLWPRESARETDSVEASLSMIPPFERSARLRAMSGTPEEKPSQVCMQDPLSNGHHAKRKHVSKNFKTAER